MLGQLIYYYFRSMKIILPVVAILLLTTPLVAAPKKVTCIIKTTMGNIVVDLYPAKAPATVANFLQYVDAHAYDSTTFFRAVTLKNQPKDSIKIEVIQGGDVDSTKELQPINLETTAQTGLKHIDGAVSMARGKPNTATSSFFICINDQPSLDYGGKRNPDGQGFAAFGKVIKGMDVVKQIQQLHPEQGQYFKPPVYIISISRK
jgi:peptidyl-prolyl cis-trans isomerase A (cyclophilin A)